MSPFTIPMMIYDPKRFSKEKAPVQLTKFSKLVPAQRSLSTIKKAAMGKGIH
jgi:hypothetical protein